MRKLLIIVSLSIMSTCIVVAQHVSFRSDVIEAAVRSHIKLDPTASIEAAQLDTITKLNLSGLQLTDIRDLRMISNIQSLDLSYNNLEDISPLATLDLLNDLNLSHNELESINMLSFSYSNEMYVNVAFNYITDFSFFNTLTPCNFEIFGAGLQKEKNAPFFDVNYLFFSIDDGVPSVSCRVSSNMGTQALLKNQYMEVEVPTDRSRNVYEIKEEISETCILYLNNDGEHVDSTFVVPSSVYYVESEGTIVLTTGLPNDFTLSNVYAEHGTVKIVDNTIEYSAPNKAVPDIVNFCYFKGGILKGSSRFYINREKVASESIKISSAKQVTYMSDKDLDFTGYPDLKAYVATGYDKSSGTIWLTRVKEVPAHTGFMLMGEANTYEIPAKAGGLSAYYQNMFKGTLEGTTIQTTDGDYTNYYLSNGDAGVGFYKVTKAEGVALAANRAYLSVPTEIPAVGATGSTETIKVSAAGQVPYYNSQSLDFSSLDAQGVKAYTATGYDYGSGTIWLTRVKQIPAETGILIMAPQGEYPVPTASVASVYANMFKGTLTGTTIQTHETIAGEDYINYYLSSGDAGVGFYKVTKEGGVTIGANRCYLPIKNKEAAGTRSAGSGQTQIAFEEADEVIGIQLMRGIGDENGETTNLTPALSKGEGEGEWYTLQGQRVAKPGKGLYIHNGKVVVIRSTTK